MPTPAQRHLQKHESGWRRDSEKLCDVQHGLYLSLLHIFFCVDTNKKGGGGALLDFNRSFRQDGYPGNNSLFYREKKYLLNF